MELFIPWFPRRVSSSALTPLGDEKKRPCSDGRFGQCHLDAAKHCHFQHRQWLHRNRSLGIFDRFSDCAGVGTREQRPY